MYREEGTRLNRSELVEKAMHEHTDLLFRIAYYYVKDKYLAEDLVQDVFLKLYCSNYIEQGELRAYLSRLTANVCKDYLKSWAYRKVKLTMILMPQEKIIHKDALVEKDELNVLDAAVLALPLKQREAIVYYYLEGLSIKEIAALLNRPESTVKSRLKSAKEQLKRKLGKEEWEVLLHD